ncbi:MAG: hypothetical protein LBG92_09045 [Prevotellaceae bacterium]|jgi:hypothetical protein|nr:hypothetical protein [Prevotellaceae bacterium]
MSFCSETETFISENFTGEILTDKILCSAFSHVILPQKNLVFLLIPMPSGSMNGAQKMFFQNLSIAAANRKLHLVTVWEDLWTAKNSIVRLRILSHLGKFKRIHARQCSVERIAKRQADEFLTANHLHGSPTAKYKYGLFYNRQLVAVATFSGGRPIVRNGKTCRSHELIRFANLQNSIVTGGVGKLLAHFISERNPDDVMSYADVDWASGKSYIQLGFKFTEYTEPQKFYLNTQTCERYRPDRLPAELHNRFLQQTLSIDDFMAREKIFAIYNSGNKKFLLELRY